MNFETRKQAAEALAEDFAATLHRYVCRLTRQGVKDPLAKMSRLAKIPIAYARNMHLGLLLEATVRDHASLAWAYGELRTAVKVKGD